jgi:hypothetical protein
VISPQTISPWHCCLSLCSGHSCSLPWQCRQRRYARCWSPSFSRSFPPLGGTTVWSGGMVRTIAGVCRPGRSRCCR